MTRLALPGKCGALGASGLEALRDSSASNCEMIPGSTSEPLTSERTIWRREQEQFKACMVFGVWLPMLPNLAGEYKFRSSSAPQLLSLAKKGVSFARRQTGWP